MSTRRAAGRDPLDSITIHIGDWCASTAVARLGPSGEAYYLRLLMHQWLSEGEGLPADEAELRTMLRLSKPEWASFWRIAEPKFPVGEDGKRRNPRTHAEWQHCLKNRETARAKGSKGGQTTAKKKRSGDTSGSGPDDSSGGSSARATDGSPATPPATPPAGSPSPSPSLTTTADAAVVTPDAAAAAGLAEHFVDPRHREAYAATRRSHRFPEQLDAMVAGLTEGLGAPRGRPLAWRQLGQGLLDLRAQQRDVTTFSLGAFAAKVPADPVTPLELVRDDLPGTVRTGDGDVVWHPGMPTERPSDDDIAANGWSVAA